jgi:hypothetical protein
MPVCKDEEMFLEVPLWRLQDISIWSDRNDFFEPYQKTTTAFYRGTFIHSKNVQNGGAFQDLFLKASFLHGLQNLDHLELYSV